MKTSIIFQSCFLLCLVFFLLNASTLVAQTNDKATDIKSIDHKALPKSNQIVLGKTTVKNGVKNSTIIATGEYKNLQLSEMEVIARLEADGKMSKKEKRLLEMARRQPQSQ